jgi:hypothetical protein
MYFVHDCNNGGWATTERGVEAHGMGIRRAAEVAYTLGGGFPRPAGY